MATSITFGKYLLLDRINVGGMAEVFKAKTFGIEGFERIIAIKRILPNMADDEEFINMFVDEARIAVQLSHANIVQIYELGKIENQYYIAMEYISGKDLRQILDRYRKHEKTIPLPAAAYIVSRICEGLDYAHRKADPAGKPLNVIHRDVSPQNILISYEGAVKITDFGIAKAEDRASKTQAGVLKGKFGYMSPEQVRGLEIDRRSDIFAMGILLYEMVTGKRLFVGESDFSTLEHVRKAEVVPPSEHNQDIPPEFEQIVLRALARERDQRYQWASELLDDLQRFTIDDNTIFNAKRMSGVLRDDYQAEIDAEMQRMEEYMRLVPPDASLTAEPGSGFSPGDPNKNDRTMIFESGFADLENMPTQIGESVSDFRIVTSDGPAESLSPVPRGTIRSTRRAGVPAAFVATVAVVFVAFASLLVYALVSTSRSSGSLLVTTTPVSDQVEIVLDDEIVATTAPFYRDDISAGKHRLEVRAAGFAPKAYEVNVPKGDEIVVRVEFDTAVPRNDGTAQISTDPSGAAVYFEGTLIGTTPHELRDLDTGKAFDVSLRLDGYKELTLRGSFAPGASSLSLEGKLEKLPSTASIQLNSRPAGATVFQGRKRVGTTPVRIEDLDPKVKHAFELVLEGYKPVRMVQAFDKKLDVKKDFVMERKPRRTSGRTAPSRNSQKTATGKCEGSSGTFSVMVLGQAGCSIRVGARNSFKSPMFKKAVPTGRCTVLVSCPSGKSYREVRNLKDGDNGKLIVKPDMMK